MHKEVGRGGGVYCGKCFEKKSLSRLYSFKIFAVSCTCEWEKAQRSGKKKQMEKSERGRRKRKIRLLLELKGVYRLLCNNNLMHSSAAEGLQNLYIYPASFPPAERNITASTFALFFFFILFLLFVCFFFLYTLILCCASYL